MTIRITTKNTILFLTMVLLIYHTLTFMQAYYSFYITVGVFGLILALYLLGYKKFVINKKFRAVLLFDAATILIILAAIYIRNFDPVQVVGQYFPYIMWSTLYVITEPLFDEQTRKKAIGAVLVVLVIGVIATLNVVMVDNEAARLLAGAAKGAVRQEYYRRGVGGYGFVYGMVFILFCILAWMMLEKKLSIKVLLLTIGVTVVAMIFFASYTAAILLTVVTILLAVFSRTKQKNATLFLILGACVLALFFEDILIGLRDFAETLDMQWITKRINQLLEAETSGDMESLRRVELYQISIETFFSNILLGGSDIGGHSMFLDTLANYGLIGVLFLGAFLKMLNEERRNCTVMKGSIYYLCILLLCINTMDIIVLLPMMLFALPLFLKAVDDKKRSLQQ